MRIKTIPLLHASKLACQHLAHLTRRKGYAVVGALLFLLFPFWLPAQSYIADYSSISYRQGLEGKHPDACLASSDGMLWVLTGEALNGYDGYRIQKYSFAKPSPDYINELLYEDTQGLLWIGSVLYLNLRGGGAFEELVLHIFDPDKGQSVPFDDYFSGKIPFSSQEITSINQFEGELALYISTKKGRVFRYADGSFELWKQIPATSSISDLYRDKEGTLWWGAPRMISCTDAEGSEPHPTDIQLSPSHISGAFPGWLSLWFPFRIGYEGELVQRLVFNKSEKKLTRYLSFPNGDTIDIGSAYGLHYDTTHHLLHLINGENWKVYSQQGDVVFDMLKAFPEFEREYFIGQYIRLTQGKDGALYANFFSRIVGLRISPSPFQKVLDSDRLSLRDIVPGSGDTLLISTYSGIYGYSISGGFAFRMNESKDQMWLSALKQPGGEIWGSSHTDWIRAFDEKGQLRRKIEIKLEAFKPHHSGYKLLEDSRGQVWLTTTEGIAKYDTLFREFVSLRRLSSELGLYNKTGNHLAQHDSLLWVSFQNGLRSFTLDGEPAALHLDKPNLEVLGFQWAGSDTCWLATAGQGLWRWTPSSGKLRQFTARQHGLSDDYIYSVHIDGHGRLWLPTNQGLSCFIPATLQVNVYHRSAGLHGDEFNRFASYESEDGTLWLGGVNGLTWFHPDSISIQEQVPIPLRIVYCGIPDSKSGLLEDNTADCRRSGQIILGGWRGRNACVLRVLLASYISPEKNQYFWSAEGLTDGWQLIDGNQLTLADLPYGTFDIRLRGRTENRAWSSEELLVTIIVLRPFYLQWWFWLIVIASGGLLLAGFIHLRTENLKRSRERLKKLVAERTAQIRKDRQTILQQKQELETLNLGKDKVMSIIGHELKGNLFFIYSAAEQIEQLLEKEDTQSARLMLANVQKATMHTNEVIENLSRWTAVRRGRIELSKSMLKPSHILQKVVQECQLPAEKKGIQLELITPESEPGILADPNALRVVFLNLVRNAIKFTDQGGQVKVEIGWEGSQPTIQVQDNGVGMEPELVHELFEKPLHESRVGTAGEIGTGLGLSITQELLRGHEARVEVKSKPGKGSLFTVYWPQKN